MKVFILGLIFYNSVVAQIPVSKVVDPDMIEKLNQAGREDQLAEVEAKRREAMDDYMKKAIEAINEHKRATKDVTVGNFKIRIQHNCDIKLPEKPVIPNPVEQECASGDADAQALADMVVEMSNGQPLSPDEVTANMIKCKMNLSQKFTIKIYDKCLEKSFNENYKKAF